MNPKFNILNPNMSEGEMAVVLNNNFQLLESVFTQIPSPFGYYSTKDTYNFNPGDTATYSITDGGGGKYEVTVVVPEDGTNVLVDFRAVLNTNSTFGAHGRLYKNGSLLQDWVSLFRPGVTSLKALAGMSYLDPGLDAGTYTYEVRVNASGSVSPNLDFSFRYITARVVA